MIQDLKLENSISYGHAMRFLLHVVALVSHSVVFYTTLPHLFIHSSQLEFRNLDIFIRYHMATYEVFIAFSGSCLSLHSLLHNLTLPFHSVLSARVWNLDFSSHVVAYIVRFDSRFETRKSDIIRPRYELFNACGGSCPSLPCL